MTSEDETDDTLGHDSVNTNLVEKQSQLRSATQQAQHIQRFTVNLKKTSSNRINKGFLEARADLIQSYWDSYRSQHELLNAILTTEEASTLPYYIADEFSKTEDAYLEASTYIHQKNHELFPPVASTSQNTSPMLDNNRHNINTSHNMSTHKLPKLPPVTIPKFNGEYQTWPSFFDLFKSLIHDNVDIPPVQKLHYLKTSLIGEPERLIRNLHVTDLNYDPAWKQLIHRYNNKKILINAQLDNIFNLPKMRDDTPNLIKQLLDTTSESIISLQGLGIDTSSWDSIIIYMLVKKLTPETHKLWEQTQRGCDDLPTFAQFKEFLESHYRTLEVINSDKKHSAKDAITTNSKGPANINRFAKRQSYHASATTNYQTNVQICVLCKGNHSIRLCEQFKSKSPSLRLETAKTHKLCTNCLSKAHSSARCSSNKRCLHCQKRHHTLLHSSSTFENNSSIPTASSATTSSPSTSSTQGADTSIKDATKVNTFHASNNQIQHIILATALVRITSDSGHELIVRALLDQASEGSFITEATARRLQLKFKSSNTTINGIGQGTTSSASIVTMKINAYFQDKVNLTVNAYVLKSISGVIPAAKLPLNSWEHTSQLKLADPEFHIPGKIDILLGVEVYNHILLDSIIRGSIGSPLAQKTKLGWILSGQVTINQETAPQTRITVSSHVTRISLEEQLKQFWELEEIPTAVNMSSEEIQCEKIFNETHKRNADGRFIVQLPFVKDFGSKTFLGRSRATAISRFRQIEQRLKKHSDLQVNYSNCIREYLILSHMEPTRSTEDELVAFSSSHNRDVLNCCYIPHHAVTKESSTTTKTRVVFDASCSTSSGKSLNDCLLNGPTLQEDISSITLRWRKHRVVITGDIEKMYRQIRVTDKDADFQRIIWRWSPTDPLQEYRLQTLTFGTKSAAYLAVKCIQTLATSVQLKFPVASEAIVSDLYVDDLLSGSDTIEEAILKRSQITEVLHQGGFEMRKWASNESTVMQVIPAESCEPKLLYEDDDNNTIKTLGLYWDPSSDHLSFKVNMEPTAIISKRAILSDVAKLYDPNGWLSPITVRAKILLQSLWLTGLTWDDDLPNNISESWLDFRTNLWHIEDIRIPRWLNTVSTQRNTQLHCFTDASVKAYAAAIYVRTVDEHGIVSVLLLTAKTKVAPIKQVSVPRLELCGVVLGAKLLQHAQRAMKIPFHKIFGWTDSSIVLSWLKEHPSKWKTFVANRIGEIHRTSDPSIWRYVPTKENPADVASRGIGSQELQNHSLWWQGPTWLTQEQSQWPILKTHSSTDLEERKVNTFIATTKHQSIEILERFSTFNRLIRCTSYIFRFINNSRRINVKTSNLTATELSPSLSYWIHEVQRIEFSAEINNLSTNKGLNTQSKLLNLNPILDDQGFLRVGGRLQHAHLSYDAKHPVILPSKNHLTSLLINHYHQLTLHGGPQIICGLMRTKYWVLDARNTTRNVISKCVICRRQQATIKYQLMGQLPTRRTSTGRAFQHSGVDYAGPFDIKLQSGRGSKYTKGYICLFICMATKAVHLELASDLTSQCFLGAFRRFVARRGLCTTISSDNGTNFVGAARILKEDFNKSNIETELAKLLANDGVEWKFIPPGSPNFGGLWEAGIKSTKYHLKRVLGCSSLTYEEFSTVLVQIEGVLNSRPLCPMRNDPSDLEALTPGHFLIGGPIVAPPEPNLLEINLHRLTRWQRIQQLYQAFWSRWNVEYVSRQQQRPKWLQSHPNISINDMVLIKQENLPPTKWLLGRVTSTRPGSDGIVRVVSVRTKNGETLKTVSKLCLLPVGPDTDVTQQ